MNYSLLISSPARLVSVLFTLLLLSFATYAQTPAANSPGGDSAANVTKAESVLRRAIEAMGGSRYLSVRSVVGRGRFTTYEGGVSGAPYRFEDFVLYPDSNRTEFHGRGNRIIQSNTATTGWLFDSASRKLEDAKPEQLQDYSLALRTSIDGLLRGTWRTEGKNRGELSYMGRREASLGQRNEAVRLTYADGFNVDFEFGARDGLPAKLSYKRTRKQENKDGIEETIELTEEDRFAQFVETEGVRLPFIIDHFRGGIQTSRVNYEAVSFDEPFSEGFFARPATIKDIKERKKK